MLFATAGGPPGPAELAYVSSTFDDTDGLTARTFSSHAIGDADSFREVMVVCKWRNAGGDYNISSATIGGVTADIHVQSTQNDSRRHGDIFSPAYCGNNRRYSR